MLNINPAASRKNPDNDTTRAIMDVLFQGTDEQKAQQYSGSKVVIGKAADAKQQEEGIATIYVGGKEVPVVNGLPYLVTNQGNVIPLMSRKVTEDEVDTILDLLEASIDSDTILTSEGLEAEEKKEKEEEKKEADKKVFVPLKVQDSKKIAAAKKRGKFLNAFYDKKRKKWGYLAAKSVKGKTKKVHRGWTWLHRTGMWVFLIIFGQPGDDLIAALYSGVALIAVFLRGASAWKSRRDRLRWPTTT